MSPLLAPSQAIRRNLAEALQSIARFSTFTRLLAASGIEPMLRTAGPYTVFAPDDAAFDALGVEALVALEADGARLRAVLQYHVLRGALAARDLRHGGARTIEGTALQIGATDDGFTVDHANVTAVDLHCANGIIHPIDAVIMPGFSPAISPAAREDSPWSGRKRVLVPRGTVKDLW